MENGILLPTLQSALPFLDLHGTPRLEFHQSVFDELRDKLMERVAIIAEGKEEDRYVSVNFDFVPWENIVLSSVLLLYVFVQIWKTWRAPGEELSTCENAVYSASGNASAETSTQGKWLL